MQKLISLILIVITILNLSLISCQQILQQTFQLNQQQIHTLKQLINGRTINGSWNCVQELFYQPSQCKYFPIPLDTVSMINTDSVLEPYPFFKQTNQGMIEGFFYSSNENSLTDRLYLVLYRERYRTGQVIEIDLDLTKAEHFIIEKEKNGTKVVAYKQDSLITTASLYQNQQMFIKLDVSLDIEIFINSQDFQSLKTVSSPSITTPINIRIFSESLSFASSLTSPTYSTIILILLSLSLLQAIFIFINPSVSKENAAQTRRIMFRVSQWFILQMYSFIIIFSKEYIKLGLKYFDTQLGYLIYLGLGNIGIGLFFLKKYQMVLEKFTNKRTLLLAVVFFCCYWYLASRFLHDAFFWVVEIAVMMQLQIIHSMINGGKGGLPYDLMGFMIVSRLPLIYMEVYQDNIFKMPPVQSQYMELFISVFIFHCIIIFIQSVKGGQFIIPNQIIPGYYNYFFTEKSTNQKLKEQCPICTTLLNQSPDSTIEMTEVQGSSIHSMQENQSKEEISVTTKTQNDNDDLKAKTVRVMKTPCGHMFHIDCLTKWMQAKLVCPYCRSTLPQLAALEKE